jgi:hypothetical protein
MMPVKPNADGVAPERKDRKGWSAHSASVSAAGWDSGTNGV